MCIFRFTKRFGWGIGSSGMWRCITSRGFDAVWSNL